MKTRYLISSSLVNLRSTREPAIISSLNKRSSHLNENLVPIVRLVNALLLAFNNFLEANNC